MAAKKKTKKKKATKKKAVRKKGADRPPRKKASKKTAAQRFKPGKWHVTQTEAADFCEVAIQVFQRRSINPAGKVGRYTYYDLRDIKEWEKQREREAERKRWEKYLPDDGDDQSLAKILVNKEKAELDWTKERAEGQRLKNAEMRRELARIEMIAWALGSIASQVASILGTLPAKLKRSMPKLSSDEMRIIKSEIVKAQNACAKECELDWDEFPD